MEESLEIEKPFDFQIIDPLIYKSSPATTADELIKAAHFITVDEKLYNWDAENLAWIEIEPQVKSYLRNVYRDQATTHLVKEIIDQIKIATDSRLPLSKIDEVAVPLENGQIRTSMTAIRYGAPLPSNLIPLSNAFLNTSTYSTDAMAPWYWFKTKLPITRDPAADCPTNKKFFDEIVSKEDRINLEELIGYCLLGEYPIHKAFMLVGEGRNGKTTFLNLLQTFLGNENVSNVAYQDMYPGSFMVYELKGKLANIRDDLPAKGLEDTGIFKQLTGQSPFQADRKHKESVRFYNHAKLVFSCNRYPGGNDPSLSYEDRWIIIQFPNTFIGSKADKQLLQKLTTREELSGLLNLALLRLKGLIERGDFNKTLDPDENGELIDRLGDPLAECLDTLFNTEDFQASESRDIVFKVVNAWNRSKRYPVLPLRQLTIALQRRGFNKNRKRIAGVQVPSYQGLQLNEEGRKYAGLDPTTGETTLD